jgi:hypothetical protein
MPTALELADEHRTQQNRLAAILALQVIRYFEVFKPPGTDIVAAGRTWLAAVLPAVSVARRASTMLAASYWDRQRLLAVPGAPSTYLPPIDIVEVNLEQVTRSLAFTGPGSLQQKIERGMDRARAVEQAQVAAAGAAQRHALAGGREALIDAFQSDEKAIGWFRVTRAAPCYFCAMLASRGPVYKKDSFDSSDARFEGGLSEIKVHDSCGCFLVPMYDRTAPQPGTNERFTDLWYSATKGKSGQQAVNAFRAAYEGR